MLYILVPATLFIWGAIGYTIFSHLHQNNSFAEVDYIPFTPTVKDTIIRSYTLLANYRDPFRSYHPSVKKEKKSSEKPKEEPVVTRNRRRNRQRVYWPQVKYNGLITNNNNHVALLQISNRNYLLKEGDEKDRIKLLKLYPDSVVLEYEGEPKTISKN
jgi:hypothetical protein